MNTSTTKSRKRIRVTKIQHVPSKFRHGFLSDIDGRTELSRTLRGNFEQIVQDVGGASEVSHVKKALIERFVWLEAILQDIEQSLVSGEMSKTEAIGRWVQAINSLTGLAKVLGIDRKSRTTPWLNGGEK